MAARASFSNDSRIVKVPLPKSVLLKDYLIDDLSSCSSNGFRSYPRRQCCTKVRYLIEIDLNKHIKLPQKQKKFLKSKSKSSLVLHKASAVLVNVFKHFRFSGTNKPTEANFLPKNLSRKQSKRRFWNKTTNRHDTEFNKRLNSFDKPVKEKKDVPPPPSKVSTAITTTAAEVNTSTSNSNSTASSDSYFTATSVSSITNNYSEINFAQNDVEKCELHATEKKNTAKGMKAGVATAMATATATATATSDSATNGNAKNLEGSDQKKEQFSPVSVMDFPCEDDEDEVTSPFQHHSHLYAEGSKQKLTTKVKKIKIKPVRLEDRITVSELHGQSSNQTEKKASALLQQLKATMSSCNQLESKMTQNVLLGFFIERIIEGNVSNFTLLQEAKDWINGHAIDTSFESQNNKLAYIKDMDKEKVKWSKYEDEVEKQEVVMVLEFQVFTSLIEEMLLEFYT